MRICHTYLLIYAVFACHLGIYADIQVGILHSLTGTLAISEKPVVDATQLAIDNINADGGVNGHKLVPIIADGASDPEVFAKKAQDLIQKHNVSVIFGCWSSATRKRVKPIVEKHNSLLFYPVQYEGIEQSTHIIYTGLSPNQQVIPAVMWALTHLGERIYLVGSDYVFPRVANEIAREVVSTYKGNIVGEAYLPLGSSDVAHIVDDIIRTKPDVIVNTINGETNIPFFTSLRKQGVYPSTMPTISLSISENELEKLDVRSMVGDYACWGYFHNIESLQNRDFVAQFQKRFGEDRMVNDPMQAAYVGVHIWRRAAEQAKTWDPRKLIPYISNQFYAAPEGNIYVDTDNQHTWRHIRIGKIRFDGNFTIIWQSQKAVYPQPYPQFRSQENWDQFLENLYTQWGGQWQRT